jgi:hypothetical protein
MTKVITISKDNKAAIRLLKTLQQEKKRLGQHVIKGGKLDDFKFNINP